MDSRISSRAPLRILCQHDGGGCAACCGIHNFKDRSPDVEDARLQRRTDMVRAAWPIVDALAAARDALLVLEQEDVLFAQVKVCPFAGYVERGRIGCLIHPSRHPQGEDLRDLAVYPRDVCAGHFCASHDWLRPREADLAQTAEGNGYSRVVSDARLVKAVAALLDEQIARSFTRADVVRARPLLVALWRRLLSWPFLDPHPARFGAFVYEGDDASERTVPSCIDGLSLQVSRTTRAVLDALGTRQLNAQEAEQALRDLDDAISDVRALLRSA